MAFTIRLDHPGKSMTWGLTEKEQPFLRIVEMVDGQEGKTLFDVTDLFAHCTLQETLAVAAGHGFTHKEIETAHAAYDHQKSKQATALGQLFGQPWRTTVNGEVFGLVRGYIVITATEAFEVIYACASHHPVEVIEVNDGNVELAICQAGLWLRQKGLPIEVDIPLCLPAPSLALALETFFKEKPSA